MKKENIYAVLAMVVILGLSGLQIHTKIQLNNSVSKADAQKDTRIAAELGYISGCIMTVMSVARIDGSDPMFVIYKEACMNGAQAFASHIDVQ